MYRTRPQVGQRQILLQGGILALSKVPRHDEAHHYPVIMLVYGQACVAARIKKQICRVRAALGANEPFMKLFLRRRSHTCYVCGVRESLYVGGSNRWMSIIIVALLLLAGGFRISFSPLIPNNFPEASQDKARFHRNHSQNTN